jgi:hypothetical protein
MKRRDFILSAGATGLVIPALGRGATPCPPPQMSVAGGSTVTTSCGKSYSTNFPATENPISENGEWVHLGEYWSVVQTTPGFAFGTQTGGGGYDDSYAHLTGFGPNHTAQATIRKGSNLSGIHEVELHLRWNDSTSSASGYECNIAWDGGYCQIVRWNGGFGSWAYVATTTGVPAPVTGDVFKASIVGNLIIVYLNDRELIRGTDSTFASGNPGMGFYREAAGSNTDYGFSSYSATST